MTDVPALGDLLAVSDLRGSCRGPPRAPGAGMRDCWAQALCFSVKHQRRTSFPVLSSHLLLAFKPPSRRQTGRHPGGDLQGDAGLRIKSRLRPQAVPRTSVLGMVGSSSTPGSVSPHQEELFVPKRARKDWDEWDADRSAGTVNQPHPFPTGHPASAQSRARRGENKSFLHPSTKKKKKIIWSSKTRGGVTIAFAKGEARSSTRLPHTVLRPPGLVRGSGHSRSFGGNWRTSQPR